jgi:hypothetical protein
MQSWSDQPSGPLTLTLKLFEGNQQSKPRWETELKGSGTESLFHWDLDFDPYNSEGLRIKRTPPLSKNSEIESVSILTILTSPMTLLIERDYKNYQFLLTWVDQTTEKHADELNILVPNQRFGPIRPSQTIIWLSGNCIKR